ncbi:MAG: hypothetical protein AABX14_00460 [Candidatus Aenigmatarchaeota archaeon]
MCSYLSSIVLDDIMGKNIGVRSAESGLLFFGRLEYFDNGKHGCYLVIDDRTEIPSLDPSVKTFGPLHSDDEILYVDGQQRRFVPPSV